MNSFTSILVTLPEDLPQQVEACLEFLRGQFLDPADKKEPGQMISVAMSAYTQLLSKLCPAAMDLAESGILLQSAALSATIYFVNGVTPGEWVQESTEDFTRAYVAILMLMKLPGAQDAAAQDAELEAAELEAAEEDIRLETAEKAAALAAEDAPQLVVSVDLAAPGTDQTVVVEVPVKVSDVVAPADDPNGTH